MPDMTALAFIQSQSSGVIGGPVSIGTVMAVTVSGVTFALVLYDRVSGKGKAVAKMDAKLDRMCSELEEVQITQKKMDEHVRDLVSEIRGTDGTNGLRGRSREHVATLRAIEARHTKEDAIAGLEYSRMREQGVEKPRRLRDEGLEG